MVTTGILTFIAGATCYALGHWVGYRKGHWCGRFDMFTELNTQRAAITEGIINDVMHSLIKPRLPVRKPDLKVVK